MKWTLMCFGLILWATLFLQTEAFAQSQTKCPPRAKKYKARKELVKFPSLIEREKDRTRAEKKMGFARTPRERETRAKEVDKRENFYVKTKQPKVKIIKVASKSPSTDCPR